jgi:hypothetical protein
MNRTILSSVKYIKTKHGEAILGDPVCLNSELVKYIKNEPKEERTAFGRCIEMGCYTELKKARSEDERINIKDNLALQVNNKHNIPLNLCHDVLDILDEVIFGSVSQKSSNYQNTNTINNNPIGPTPPPINNNIPLQNQYPPTPDKKSILRMLSKFALLLVIIGFFMPITCKLNAFEIAHIANSNLMTFCVYAIFILSCIGVFIGLLLLMKVNVPMKYDWFVILGIIGIILYFIFSGNSQGNSSTFSLKPQEGAYVILAGIGLSFLLLMSAGSESNTNNNTP